MLITRPSTILHYLQRGGHGVQVHVWLLLFGSLAILMGHGRLQFPGRNSLHPAPKYQPFHPQANAVGRVHARGVGGARILTDFEGKLARLVDGIQTLRTGYWSAKSFLKKQSMRPPAFEVQLAELPEGTTVR